MRCVDLFAGPGGWSEGIAPLGITDIGLEMDADACLTRRAAGHQTIRTDVAAYPPEAFRDFDGLIASPPCQAFSTAGKRKGIDDLAMIHDGIEACRDGWAEVRYPDRWADERSPLILEPLRWAWAIRPTWIACEQVPPCLPVWEHMADVLRAWGYQATALKLCAADYGVPQTRTRAFLLAHRDELCVAEPSHAKHPEPGLFGNRRPWVTMAEALGWEGERAMQARDSGPAAARKPRSLDEPSYTIRAAGSGSHPCGVKLVGNNSVAGEGRAERNGDEPALTVGSRADLWRLRAGNQANATTRDGDEPAPTIAVGNYHDGKVAWVRTSFGEPHRGAEAGSPKPEFNPTEQPCRTVNTKTGDWVRTRPATSVQSTDRIGRPGTKDWANGESQFDNDAVRITLEEAAVLQGFRPDYPFQGTKTSRFRQVGNAVCPTWAAKIIAQMTAHTPGES